LPQSIDKFFLEQKANASQCGEDIDCAQSCENLAKG